MNEPVFIPGIFREVVEECSKQLSMDLHFEHGHPSEIVESLQKMTLTPYMARKKYPLVALFQDFTVKRGTRADLYGEVSVTVIIATLTDPFLNAPERYENNFFPVLYPIYAQFIMELSSHKSICIMNTATEPEHDQIDRLYWGKEGLFGNTANTFNDYIDAIEIKNLQLKIFNPTCQRNGNTLK